MTIADSPHFRSLRQPYNTILQFSATMRHPDPTQSADASNQFKRTIERINNAMRTLDQLIARAHTLSVENHDIPAPFDKHS
ncbi:MAG: hypothetical protein NPIRA02_09420 [Nitrospirales bacterium]|nr:MAG: hypothetical protein NPIRA02_09420 [Nitrospirales bacterium]